MRSWIRVSDAEAELEFWKYFDFPMYYGESPWEVRCGRRKCKRDYDQFVEKSAFKVFYNPWEDKFRVYLDLRIPKSVKVIDPDKLCLRNTEFYEKIDRFYIERKDFKYIMLEDEI